MDDNKCSICKTDLEEIVISSDKELEWEACAKKKMLRDKEDNDVYYEDGKAKASSMKLRSLQCLMHNCDSNKVYPN